MPPNFICGSRRIKNRRHRNAWEGTNMIGLKSTKRITAAVGVTVATLMLAPAASAAVTLNANGTGFVGKGDVQTAFGWNNKQLQTNATGVSFSFTQDATQAVTQSASQTASQTTSQSFIYYVSCNTAEGKKTFYREGNRSGVTTATREGERVGERAGTLSGAISSALDGDPRQTKGQNQFTGFILKGYAGTPTFTASGAPVYDEPTFGDWDWSTDAVEVDEWTSGWKTTGEGQGSPADCLSGSDGDSNIVEDTTYGDLVEGPIQYGEVTYGDVSYGDVLPTPGTAHVFATHNGVTKQLS
jgi:hypothetical protein